MKRLPLLLSGIFLAITLTRVAAFTDQELKAGILGWLFSIALGIAVYTAAYWTRVQSTRRQAIVALGLFVLVDAALNLAHVWISADTTDWIVASTAILYGLFPTCAVALLGWLSGAISKLPPGVGERSMSRIEQAAAARIAGLLDSPAAYRAEAAERPAEKPVETSSFQCQICRTVWPDAKSYGGHMSHHHNGRVKQKEKTS